MGMRPDCLARVQRSGKRARIEPPDFVPPPAYGQGDDEDDEDSGGICHGEGEWDGEDDAMDQTQTAPSAVDHPQMTPPAFVADFLEEEEQPCTLEGARRQARRALENPRWREWATNMVTYCEEHFLADVTANLFPSAEAFRTEETYRFMKLKALYPGASFAAELLKANEEEALDLSKVGPHNAPIMPP